MSNRDKSRSWVPHSSSSPLLPLLAEAEDLRCLSKGLDARCQDNQWHYQREEGLRNLASERGGSGVGFESLK